MVAVGLVEMNQMKRSMELLQSIKELGFQPSSSIFESLVRLSVKTKNAKAFDTLLEEMKKAGPGS